jgi:hypothetical protein
MRQVDMQRVSGGAARREQLILILAFVLVSSAAWAQKENRSATSEFPEITARGRMLAEYDVAAWYSSDAVNALQPPKGSFTRYVAKKTEAGWSVVYGRFSDERDKFLIVYEARQRLDLKEFSIEMHDPPQEDKGFYFNPAKAIETALGDFQHENRTYNASVLPAEADQMYVYFVPAQTTFAIYPIGGDVRYLVSSDGSRIVEKRVLHKAIIEMRQDFEGSNRIVAGNHTHVLSDVPEDTDVFHVLARKPLIPEYVLTENHMYLIRVDGTIERMK